MFKQLHANLWSNSVIILHSAGQPTHISGLSSFLTWVVKSAPKVFITSRHTDLFAFTQNHQKKRIWQSEQSCPQTTPPGFKCELHRAENIRRGNFQGSLVGRTEWKPSSMWGKRERTFGLCFAACRWLRPPLKCQSRPSRNTQKRTQSLYFSCAIIYVPAMVSNWVSPYTKNLPHIPQIQMEQGEVTAKGGNSWDFLELWICHMLCKILLAKRRLGLLCEKYCAWEVKRCNRASQSITSDRQLYLPHLRCSNMRFGMWCWHRALFTANANVLFILKKKKKPKKTYFALLIQNPIIIFLLKKKSHASIMLLHRFIPFRQRNIVRWKYTVADRDSLIQWLVLPYHTT